MGDFTPIGKVRSGEAFTRKHRGFTPISEVRAGHKPQPASEPAPARGHGGGFLGTVGHVLAQTGADLEQAALQAPGGLKHVGETVGKTFYYDFRYGPASEKATEQRKKLAQLETDIGTSTASDLQHPLRHPGDTLLDVVGVAAGGAGAAARGAAAGRALGEAGDIGKAAAAGKAVKALATKPKPGPRVLKVGDLEARGHYSRSALARAGQKTVDKALQKGAGMTGGPVKRRAGIAVENRLHKRAAKFIERNERVADAKARAASTRLEALAGKLTPGEQRALRIVAEEVPVGRRLGAQEMRAARAKTGREARRHQERIKVTRDAMQYLDEGPDGKPVFKPAAAKLRKVYGLLEQAAGERSTILKQLDLLDEQAQQTAKANAARVAAGATFEPPTAAKLGIASPAVKRQRAYVERLAKLHERAIDKATMRMTADEHAAFAQPRSPTVDRIGASLSTARDELQRMEETAARRVKPTGIVGAEDVTVSPQAPFIGNPVERTKIRGLPKVSSGSTFGHTTKPGSLKRATGSSVEHALERNDTTGIVAERHKEAARLAGIHRRARQIAKAGDLAPRRKDDVFVWTDKTVSQERIPAEVRKYLDNPEGIARLPEHEQTSVLRQLKDALVTQGDWRNAEQVAEFEQLANDGKGVFVPRRLLGDLNVRDYQVSGVPGMKFLDAVNNAQKAGLIYLKLNYPVVQGLSNVAMNLIQQGPFAVPNLTRAVRLDHKIGPAAGAVIDDIMGQGAIPQVAFEGQGIISRGTQRLAHAMTAKVDRPARRAAFLHEAIRAGYDTPAKWQQLISDDAKAGDLAEVAQRAKEAIVDYSELSPFERQIMRRLTFVYPWTKGATKYAGHFLRDHPVQAAALAQAGVIGQQQSDATFGPLPTYLRGLIPAGGGAVNPNSFNPFQTPAEVGEAVAGLVTGNKATQAMGQQFLSPAFGGIVAALTGRDDLGYPLNGNALQKARDLTVAQTPVATIARALAEGHTGAGVEGHAGDAARAVFGTRRPSKSFPDSLTLREALLRFGAGGFYPRRYNRAALNQNAAREKAGR